MKPVTKRVEWLLKTSPALRDSDKLLLLAYWRREGLELTAEQERKFVLTTPVESITRARRALRARFPGNEKVEQKRYTKYKSYRDEFGKEIVIL